MPHPLVLQSTLNSIRKQLLAAADEAQAERDMPLAVALSFAANWISRSITLIDQRQRRETRQAEEGASAADQHHALRVTAKGEEALRVQ